MVIEQRKMQSEARDNMRGGDGSVGLLHVVPKEHLPCNARLISLITLETGCGIGRHEHTGESEVFYVLSGEGVLDDNGTAREVRAGDSCICKNGECHAIRNERSEPLKLMAIILLE